MVPSLKTQAKSILDMRGISVEFPGVKALSDVNFSTESGSIHALIGANGAGKSTLMKVLSGVNSHYSGQIRLDGQEVEIRSPRAAKKLGIEIVYQEVDEALTPTLSVAENLMTNELVNRMGRKQFVNWKYIRNSAREALGRLNVNIDVNRPVFTLSLAEKQMLLLAAAVREKCKFLLLDEPTAPLSNTETENLFKVVRYLAKEENIGIVFISHRLAELFEICEYITIMRDAQVVKAMDITPELTIKQTVEYMLGQTYNEVHDKTAVPIGDVLLEVDKLTEREQRIKKVSLNVKSGEIIGIAGLVGAGKTELCKTLFGAYRSSSGKVLLNGKNITPRSPVKAVKNGLAFVPEERRKEGIIVSYPLYANITLSALHKFINKIGCVVKRYQRAAAKKLIGELGIKTPSENQIVANLSGGNQQKVVVGKWLVSDAAVYIFDEPTKGVDVGAKRDIFRLILDLAAKGKGVIYASCEFSEIMAIADRAYVMFDGSIVKEVKVSESNEKELLYYSTGGN